ncbi:DUF1365 domain-containing protein [Nocardia sp. 2]|uniref:DUF1365 domain-containing protein n=1 Tax=Nocardia acididurans TaxID=2802282 RepID=A0ABS1MA80_9NOCA|nr:DUF1365 domain-containing protein [Nocardia acididurans]MBL1077149.1 DUF1365 domain-containing protein [Nocardia acididurans]
MNTVTPALYFTRISHNRREPIRHGFEYRSYSWYFDIDNPPQLPPPLRPLSYFRACDHLDGPGADLRTRVGALLRAHDMDSAGPITVLMNARALGYVFDPVTFFWCREPGGALRCVIAEVHNTYGERHAYVLHPDERDRAEVGKRFHVSPFNSIEGRYLLRVPEPADTLSIRIALLRDRQPPFHATVTGYRLPVTPRTVLRAHLRAPLAPWLTTARIRRHGLALWARGLPVSARHPDRTSRRTTQ